MTNDSFTEEDLTVLVNLAESGDGEAACMLGDLYREGEHVEQNWKETFRWYHLGATQGDAQAQNNIGTMYQNGLGCEADSTLATHWYQQSAEQGNDTAQFNLAKRYQNGDGVNLDLAEAVRWFTAAAEQGNTEALCDLGTMLRFGHGGPRDLVSASQMHILASKEGDPVAVGNLADYHDELQNIALSGNAQAAISLCEIHNLGLGVEKNIPLTWAWIRWAKEYCQVQEAAEFNDQLKETHAFYEQTLDDDDRQAGDLVITLLLQQHR